MKLSTASGNDYPQKIILSNGDTVIAFTPAQAKNYLVTLVDIDECTENLKSAESILFLQDSLIRSKKEIIDLYAKQVKFQDDLKYQMKAAMETETQRFNILESAFKQEQKSQKKKKILIGSSMGIGLSLSLAFIVFQIIK